MDAFLPQPGGKSFQCPGRKRFISLPFLTNRPFPVSYTHLSEKAERFLVLAQEKKELEIGLWLHTIRQSNERLREQEHKISLANAQHEGAERELAEIEEEIESIIAQSQEVTVRIDEVRHGAARLEEEAARLEAQAAVADNSILHNNDTSARIQKDQEQAEETCRHLEERIAQERGAIEALIRRCV